MSKYTYIALIFTANLFLLAHTVIPHHHHHGTPHFDLFETHSHDDAGDCCCKHGERQTCLFELDIDAICEHPEQDCTPYGLLQHPEMFLQAAFYAVFIYDFSLAGETVPFLEPPYLISYYCDYVNAGRGLRAPPVFTPTFA